MKRRGQLDAALGLAAAAVLLVPLAAVCVAVGIVEAGRKLGQIVARRARIGV